jgi:hypothetical protein
MAVKIYKERKALVLQWDAGEYEGPILISTESEADADGESTVSSTRIEQNVGYAPVTFPLEYAGKFKATVLDNENNVIDEGKVTVD